MKLVVGLFGLLLFFGSFVYRNGLTRSAELASELNGEDTKYGMIGEGPPLCHWEVTPPEKVMSESKSESILISTKNDTDTECQTNLMLRAPGFDLSPNKEEQIVKLGATSSGSLSWILTPRKTGTFELAVSDVLNTKIFGVTVTNTFGLSTSQAKFASFLGSIFGPMFTVPWWWDRIRGKRQKQNQQNPENSS